MFDSVHHVIIEDEKMIDNCSKRFPNATELTLLNDCSLCSDWFTTNDFHDMIPLTQLTKLTIDIHSYRFDEIIKFLRFTPNLHTLIFQCIRLYGKNFFWQQVNDTFCLVSNQNKIKNVVITGDYSLKKIKVLFRLCRQIQHLTIDISQQSLEATIRFLFLEMNETTSHLSSLCIDGEMDITLINKLEALIKSKKADYSFKVVDNQLYLWW